MLNNDIPGTSKEKQRAALIAALKEHGELATSDIRDYLSVMHPAGRIAELRASGHVIETRMGWVADAEGRRHRQAVYVLQRGQT